MENLTNGEYLQAMKQQNVLDYKKSLNGYVLKSYYKTASMIAISMLGVCKLNKVPIENALEIFAIGLHLGNLIDLLCRHCVLNSRRCS
jgi:hypothetical protein